MATKKRILITAGPTWIAIDQARVISNIASGETGFILAKKFKKAGFLVTLLLGPGYYNDKIPGIKIIPFKFYEQLAKLLKKELTKYKYSAIIHTAAVADYKPKKVTPGKISSHLKKLRIDLIPTEKLINNFKKYSENLLVIGFKFEPKKYANNLIAAGKALLKQADLVVANTDKNNTYQAYILDKINKYGPFSNKLKMSEYLLKITENRLS